MSMIAGEVMAVHTPHGLWRKRGRCVYCPCGARLYKGKAPKTKADQREMAYALDAIADAAARLAAKRAFAKDSP